MVIPCHTSDLFATNATMVLWFSPIDLESQDPLSSPSKGGALRVPPQSVPCTDDARVRTVYHYGGSKTRPLDACLGI